MAKTKSTSAKSAYTHPLLVHPEFNVSGGVVTGKDPKGVEVTISVKQGPEKENKTRAPRECVVVTKGGVESQEFPGFNAYVMKVFQICSDYEGVPELVTEFVSGKVQVVKAAGKLWVSTPSKDIFKSFDTTDAGDKEVRREINAQIEAVNPRAVKGVVKIKKAA